MFEKHISSKYLETLSYNFSIKVIFIFAFIGNRMDLFYFHKNEEKPSIEWLFSGVISFDKTKNKTHQCNGNFSSFRIYSFFFVSIVFCHVIALSFTRKRGRVLRGWIFLFRSFAFPSFFVECFRKEKGETMDWSNGFCCYPSTTKRRKCICDIALKMVLLCEW